MLRDKNTLFSVIIPALNEEAYLEGCLKTLKNQNFKHSFEIIVVDNGSEDRTVKIARKLADKVILEPRKGISKALKTGCAEAQGQILAFTDADCYVPNLWLSRLSKIFRSDKNIVAVGGDYFFYEKGFIPRIIFNKIIAPFISYSYRILFFRKYPSLPNSNMAIRRDIYEKAGGYNPNIKWGQEIELCKRISKFGRIIFDPDLAVETSFRRYSGGHSAWPLVFLSATKETFITLFRYLQVTFGNKPPSAQKPVRPGPFKERSNKILNIIIIVLLLLGIMAFGAIAPSEKFFGSAIYRGSKEAVQEKLVALTFDDGPYGDVTNQVLDILKQKNVKATFFLVGKNVEEYPQIVKREVEEGHLLGNHSFNHSKWLFLEPPRAIDNNILDAEAAIEQASGLRPRFFRPPYGLKSPVMTRALRKRGFEIITWSDMTRDYYSRQPYTSIERKILKTVRGGVIIVLHDGRDTKINYPRQNMLEALPDIIDSANKAGYKFVTLDQLIGEKAYF